MTPKELLYSRLTVIYQIIEGIPDAQVTFSRPSLIPTDQPTAIDDNDLGDRIADPLGWLTLNPFLVDEGFHLQYETGRGWRMQRGEDQEGILAFIHWLFDSTPWENLMTFRLLFDGRGMSEYDAIIDENHQLSDRELFLKRINRFALLKNLR